MAQTAGPGGAGSGMGTGTSSVARRRDFLDKYGPQMAAYYAVVAIIGTVVYVEGSRYLRGVGDRTVKKIWDFDKWGRPRFASAREKARRKARDWASEQKDKVQRRLADYRDSVGAVRGKRGSRRRRMSNDFVYKY